VDRFNGCAIASGHLSRANESILGGRALQQTWQFELNADFDLFRVEARGLCLRGFPSTALLKWPGRKSALEGQTASRYFRCKDAR